MKHRLDKLEFFENKHIRAIPDEGLIWRVCQDYEPSGSLENVKAAYLRAKHPRRQKDKWTEYKPLQDQPDLFLRFAKLYERGLSVDLALGWARKYGLLGYVPDQETMAMYGERRTVGMSWEEVRGFPNPGEVPIVLGSPCDGGIGVFWEEVRRAAGVLAMYEAALSRNNDVAKEAIHEGSPFIGGRFWPTVTRDLPRSQEDRELEARLVENWVEQGMEGNYLEYCLLTAAFVVEGTVNDFCYPILHFDPHLSEHDPSQVVDVWAFENLLGAMYLQMYWLMGSGANTTRCEWCGRLISLESPYPGAKKRPKHKRFCDAYCRQKWNYHNRTKPRRQGKEPLA
jgi:hypothetical protein